MALPASGPLSMSDINNEFGRGLRLSLYRNTQYYTSSAGPLTFPTSPISFNNFYGTQVNNPVPPALRLDVATPTSGSFVVPPETLAGTVYSYAIVGGGGGTPIIEARAIYSITYLAVYGAGGGQVVTGTFTVSPGQVINYTVGAGGIAFNTPYPAMALPNGSPTTIQTSTLNGGATVTAAAGNGSNIYTGPELPRGYSGSGNPPGLGYAQVGPTGNQEYKVYGGGGGQGGAGVSGGPSLYLGGQGGPGTTVIIGGVGYAWGGGGGGGITTGRNPILLSGTSGGYGGGGTGGTGKEVPSRTDPINVYATNGIDGTGGGGGGGGKNGTEPFTVTVGLPGTNGGCGHLIIYG